MFYYIKDSLESDQISAEEKERLKSAVLEHIKVIFFGNSYFVGCLRLNILVQFCGF